MDGEGVDAGPVPAPDVLAALGIVAERFVGGGHHENWLARRDGRPVALRRYVRPPIGERTYELTVARELDRAGWPVPVPLVEPIDVDGSTWCLFSWLPGEQRTDGGTEAEQRRRGELLAELHATTSTATLTALGQRAGCVESHEVVADPSLDDDLVAYERWYPEEARLIRWHLDRARALFAEVGTEGARRVVLHGDFATWNLLFEGDRLSGLLDLEATHLNLLVADFALAWRGEDDHLLTAYDAVNPLDELDWALLVPTFWSWLFLGVADAIAAMRAGAVEPRVLRWTVGNLVKRTPRMGREATPYTP